MNMSLPPLHADLLHLEFAIQELGEKMNRIEDVLDQILIYMRQQQNSDSIPHSVSNIQHHPTIFTATPTPPTPTVEPAGHTSEGNLYSPSNPSTCFNTDINSATNEPLPLAHVFMNIPLPPTAISKDKLMSLTSVLNTYSDLINERKIGTLCVKLARKQYLEQI